MKVFLHDTLQLSHREGDKIFFVRKSVLRPFLLGGIGLLALGFAAAVCWFQESISQEAKISCGMLLVLLVFVVAIPGTERVVIDTGTRVVTTSAGTQIPFGTIRRLEIEKITDSEDSPAYRLRFDTVTGYRPLSGTYCWTEATVRAVALQILAEMPGLPMFPTPVENNE